VNGFGKVAIGHLCKFLGGYDLLLRNGMTIQEISKAWKKIKNYIIKTHQFYKATPLLILKV
jgi:hypothetical protein